MKNNSKYGHVFTAVSAISALFVLSVIFGNLFVLATGNDKIKTGSELKKFNADCILVLGAGVWSDNKPSYMLADRLNEGLRLYKGGIANKILVSGDHGQNNYDEVNVMKNYLIDAGVPSKDIFMDHAGFNTYDSMYRAKSVFNVKKMVVVSQEYHLYRALYICDRLGIEALGSAAFPHVYPGAKLRAVREWLARDKAILSCVLGVKPKYLGDRIDIHGDGDITNDKQM